MKVLVTGAAGFIGCAMTAQLLLRGDEVVGLDNLNDYYSTQLKYDRLKRLQAMKGFKFIQMDVADREAIAHLFKSEYFDGVVHLAAQAGVRHSITNPNAYIDSNIVGFANVLEGCRSVEIGHLVYASSSSVYGGNKQMPFSEHHNVDHPVSLYAATKKANELMAHTYSHLYGIPTTGLRFFTVYGPWGRPDMALFLFTKAIIEGRAIDVFNNGKMQRDFTYIDDIVDGLVRVLDKPATASPTYDSTEPDPSIGAAPYRIFNIGNSQPIQLLDFISCLEAALGIRAKKTYLPIQAGDVPATFADTTALRDWVGLSPSTPVEFGIKKFVEWYRQYYRA